MKKDVNSKTVNANLTIGIPAFNVEKTIATVALEAFEHSDEVIVCDDGSNDRTGAIAKKLGCDVVRHERNNGYGSAIKTILQRARDKEATILVTVDADGQHNMSEIDSLVKPILDGDADIVIGSRFMLNKPDDSSTPTIRKIGIKAITGLTGVLTRQSMTDAQSGLRAYGKRAISLLNPGEQGMGASTEILLMARDSQLRVLEVPVTMTYNVEKGSTINPVYHFADVFSSTIKVASIKHPLQAYGIPAVILLLVSFLVGARAIEVFATQGQFETGVVLVSVGLAVIGTVLAITALLLYVLITVIREDRK